MQKILNFRAGQIRFVQKILIFLFCLFMMGDVDDPFFFYGNFSDPAGFAWKGILIAGWFAFLFLFERFFPAARRSASSYFKAGKFPSRPHSHLHSHSGDTDIAAGPGTGGLPEICGTPPTQDAAHTALNEGGLTEICGAPTTRPFSRDLLCDRQRLISNLGLWGINMLLSPLIILPLSALAAWLVVSPGQGFLPGILGFERSASQGIPPLSALLFDLVVLDFSIYWWHRANHVFPFLWRFHQIHHLDRWLDTTSAMRFHFVEVLFSAVLRAGIILSFGISLFSVIVFETVVLFASLFNHSNLRLFPGLEKALAYVLVTPSIHWVHHHALRSDTDSNYGTVISLWDRMFKTFSPNSRDLEMVIGLEMPVIGKQRNGKQRNGKEKTLRVFPDSSLGNLLIKPFLAKKNPGQP